MIIAGGRSYRADQGGEDPGQPQGEGEAGAGESHGSGEGVGEGERPAEENGGTAGLQDSFGRHGESTLINNHHYEVVRTLRDFWD